MKRWKIILVKPILKREPDYIFFHVGTNKATNLTARDILDKLLQLKSTILDTRKYCKVIISQPTLRPDNGKATLTTTLKSYWNRAILTLSRTVTSATKNLDIRDYILNHRGMLDYCLILRQQ